MSRSHKRTPTRSYDNCDSEKSYNDMWHRSLRRVARQRIYRANPDEVVLPYEREIFDDWDFGRSRRRWFNPREHPELMRK